MTFTRGQDPKGSIGIGKEGILKEIGGIIIDEDKWGSEYPECIRINGTDINVVIVHKNDGTYDIIKNTISLSEDHFESLITAIPPFAEDELFNVLHRLQECFRKYGISRIFAFPKVKRVVAKIIAQDLVPVQPMSPPKNRWLIY